VVSTTAEHPFMVQDKGWQMAGNLRPGDLLVTPEGTVALDAVEVEEHDLADIVTVYNFHVENNLNYYVHAGDTPVLVHNNHGRSMVSISQVKQALGRAGMSVRKYDIEHVAQIEDIGGGLIFGRSGFVGDAITTGPRGRPLIEITDLGLSPANGRSAMENAVATIQHEIFHHKSFLASGGQHMGTESAAEAYADAMLEIFKSRAG
jgi:hypothetical protein